MKISEFEDRLSTVPDAKLRQMLSASRASGPEVAVKLILNECRRRGLDGLGAPAEGAFERAPGSETMAYPQEAAGYAGADAPADSHKTGSPRDEAEVDGLDSGAPATAPEWLNEETRSGMPVAVKALLVIIALGAVLGLAWKFSH
jgi:hypothetical protein